MTKPVIFCALVTVLGLSATPRADAPGWALPVPGFGHAVWVPAESPEVPVVVALGGSWDRPEWLCEMLDRAARGRFHLLCVRGRLRPERPADGPRWTAHAAPIAAREVGAALVAARHAGLGDVPLILAGFSRGAGIAAALAAGSLKAPPTAHDDEAWAPAALLLVEGGLSAPVRKSLPVAWSCGTRSCARATQRRCQRAPAPCRAAFDARVGHSYNPPWEEQGHELLDWLAGQVTPSPPRAAP